MKRLSMVAAGAAGVTFILAIILKLMHTDIITGLDALTFWRFTVVMLLFSIVFNVHGRDAG